MVSQSAVALQYVPTQIDYHRMGGGEVAKSYNIFILNGCIVIIDTVPRWLKQNINQMLNSFLAITEQLCGACCEGLLENLPLLSLQWKSTGR